MTQQHFTPTAELRQRGSRILLIALAALFLAAASAASLAAQTAGGQPSTGPAPAQTPQNTPQAAAPPPAQTDQNGAPSDVGTPTIVTRVNEVSLIFTVNDKHGHYIPDLKQSDFALLDDQKAPARVNSFHQQINLPLRVGILIDTSSSIRSRFQFEQQSATEFLLQVLRAKNDRAFVMGFDVTPTVTTDWTNNQDALETGIDKLRPEGGTALFDALYVACRDKLLTSRGPEPVRKAIILVSDGEDNQSRVYMPEAIKECERAETIIYAISTNWTPSRGEGDKVLDELSSQTGGETFYPPSVEDMAVSFKSIEEELRSQYALVYTPADFKTDGAFRTIYLYCYDRRYQVRAKKGYFAPRQ
jgi:VWFA-related protein